VIAVSLGAEHASDPRWEWVGDPNRTPAWQLRRGEGAAVGAHVEGDLAVAVFGSGTLVLGATADAAAATLAARWRRLGPAFLDGQGGDIAVLVADAGRGVLAGAVTAGPHKVWALRDGDAVSIATHSTLLGAGRAADRRYEDFLLAHGFVPEGASTFDGVHALAAGAVTTFPDGAIRPIEAPAPPVLAHDTDPDHWPKQLHELLLAAVEARAGSAREHAVFLGGFDSALVAALLVGLGHRVHAYTFGFEDHAYEQRNIDVVIQFLRADHTWVPITADVIGAGLEGFADVYSLPVSQPHYLLHTLAAARAARADGFDRVFNGDGCDAAFLGFPTVHRRATGVASMTRVPVPVVRAVRRLSSPEWFERHGGHVWRMGQGLLDEVEAPASIRGHLPFTILGAPSRARLRSGPAPAGAVPVDDVRARLAAGADSLDPARRAFHGHGLTGQSATKVDGAVAATGLAQWSPYLAPDVRAFALSLPAEALRPSDGSAAMGKDLLVRMSLELGLLPEVVVRQPKQSPSTSPVDAWYAGPLRDQVLAQLDGLPFAWDRRYVEDLLRPKWAEEQYRRRVSIDRHALRAVGLLVTYASFTARAA
jgi:asparagine synthetase B (glutamine-hydrolysing)